MSFEMISRLIFIASVCLIKFSVSQDDFLTQPWVDTISVPDVTPAYIPIYSSDVVPVNDTFNRFISVTVFEVATLFNTGTSLLVLPPANTGTYTIGGANGLTQYQLSSIIIYWNLSLGRAGTTLDGTSTPLEVVTRYFNTNYSPQTASNYRDGWFISVRRIKVVKGAPDNQNFTSFGELVRDVSAAGSKTQVQGIELDWYFPEQVIDVEYCYPGSYPSMNGQTYSSTVCYVTDNDIRTISQSQFYHSFGTLKNKAGKQYSNIKKLYKATPGTPIGGFGPIVVGYAPA